MSILYLPEAQIDIMYSHAELQTRIHVTSPKEEHKNCTAPAEYGERHPKFCFGGYVFQRAESNL